MFLTVSQCFDVRPLVIDSTGLQFILGAVGGRSYFFRVGRGFVVNTAVSPPGSTAESHLSTEVFFDNVIE